MGILDKFFNQYKTGIDRYKVKFFWPWKWCPRCHGRTFIKSQAVLDDKITNIYTCLGCGRPRKRNT